MVLYKCIIIIIIIIRDKDSNLSNILMKRWEVTTNEVVAFKYLYHWIGLVDISKQVALLPCPPLIWRHCFLTLQVALFNRNVFSQLYDRPLFGGKCQWRIRTAIASGGHSLSHVGREKQNMVTRRTHTWWKQHMLRPSRCTTCTRPEEADRLHNKKRRNLPNSIRIVSTKLSDSYRGWFERVLNSKLYYDVDIS